MSKRRLARLCAVLFAFLLLSGNSALAAHVSHTLEGSFDGGDAPKGPFQYVFGVETDNSGGPSDGDIYVAEIEEGEHEELSRVLKFDEEGNYTGVELNGSNTPAGSFSFFERENFTLSFDGIAVDGSSGPNKGDLYVGDVEHRVVDVFSETGSYICQITGATTPSASECAGASGSETSDGGFMPTGLAIDESTGDLYVSDNEHAVVDEFDPSGAFVRQITSPELKHPAAIAVDASGTIYVDNGSFLSGENTLTFDSSGTFQSVLDSAEPVAVAVDTATDDVYVSHLGEIGIREYDSAGNELADFAKSGEEELFAYLSLAVNGSTGALYAGRFSFEGGAVDVYSPDTTVPDVNVNPASEVGETTATLSGEVDPAGGGDVVSCHFDYGVSAFYHQTAACSPAVPYSSPTPVSVTLTGLTPSTTYHFRLRAANGGFAPYTRGVYAHSIDQLVITTGPPTVDEESASEIERFYATLNAKINPHGYDTKFRFEFVDDQHFKEEGFASPATRSTQFSQLGEGLKPLSVNQEIAGLAVETTYHYRAVAVSPRGEAKGPEKTFTTRPVATIDREWAYAHVRSADVESKINPEGIETTCAVQWVDDATFQQSGYADAQTKPCASRLGNSTVGVITGVKLEGLALSTKYHFRFIATNASGTLVGSDETFATFGIESFSVEMLDEEGNPYTQAGGHPYEKVMHYSFSHTFVPNRNGSAVSLDALLKDFITESPAGEAGGNIEAMPRCPGYQADEQRCSKASEVGYVTVEYLSGGTISTTTKSLYDLAPPEGVASRYAVVDPYIPSDSHTRSGSDYGITAGNFNITEEARIVGATVVSWGVPADHNGSGNSRAAVIRNPTSCAGPLTVTVKADSWQEPDQWVKGTTEMPATTGCDKLEFHSSIEWQPTSHVADSPTGLHVDIHQPQNEDPDGLSYPDLKNVVMSPAKGLILNPSGVSGLVGCSPAQIGLHKETPAHCPDAAKVGRVEIDTPLVDHPLHGGIYLATPHDNPFNSMFAIYVAVADAKSGVVAKLAGEIQTDPRDGQLTASFSEDPQQPVEDFKLDFFGGPRAVLRTPAECGTFVTESALTPWSTPQSGPPARPTDSYEITSEPNGRPCVVNEDEAPNKPEFRGGMLTPTAGAYSPFVIRLHREDGTQRIAKLSIKPPPGLLGRLAGIPRCPDAAIENASRHSGTEELERPSCPEASRVGTVVVGAGAGSNPYYQTGNVYLGGPYRGAPFSIAVIVPAVAGPFDLGTVVVRTPLKLDLETGQIEVESDPIPTVMEGVQLDVRTIAVKLDRPDFTINPTSCVPSATLASVTSLSDQSVLLSDPFQANSCESLGFVPKVRLELLGKTHRRSHPVLRAVLTMPPSGANIARIAVTMPPTEFLDNEHIAGICTREQFAAQRCPANSVYGHSTVWTPLLDHPLTGPIIMRSSTHRLPDLVAELNGEFRLALASRIGSAGGGVQTQVSGVPDAPLSKFVLKTMGGSRGLLQNSVNVCRHPQRARVVMESQNGKIAVLRPMLRPSCPVGPGSHTRRP